MKLISEHTHREISAVLGAVSQIRADMPPKHIDALRRAQRLHKRLAAQPGPEAASQCVAILEYLKTGRGITPLEALNRFGCFRLSARIWDLRMAGHPIQTHVTVRGGKRFAKYCLKEG